MTISPPQEETRLLAFLDEIGVSYDLHRHAALFTVEDSKAATAHLPGAHTKNMFLKERKGGFWLVTCLEDRRIRIKHLEKAIGAKRLSSIAVTISGSNGTTSPVTPKLPSVRYRPARPAI